VTESVLSALYGGSAAVFAMVGLVFLRCWVDHRDRLFAWFAAAFWCFAAGFVIRIATDVEEQGGAVFVPRLIGFLLIILAIIDKNRDARSDRE
jgi:Family of unknown function (DUF5985)